MRTAPAVLLCGLALCAARLAAAQPSPYAGEEARAIKSLSEPEIADLLGGHGMGMAKAGELNGFPGPAHVLELAQALGLTPQQTRAVTAIHTKMAAAAKPLGAEIVAHERRLDHAFAAGTVTDAELHRETRLIGELQGRLRAVHLGAHIETKRVLTQEQVARYAELRGYSGGLPAPGMLHHHQAHAG
jgi:hypothetical protein